ncbi:MAG: hypothetical protein IK072_05205 [Clostridia bacterium]|nr:hypothetical protein [Clostridia bacterium]
MENSFIQRYTFKFLMTLAFISGFVFFYMNNIDFISVAIEYGKMNIPNIAYAFLRIFGGVFIPVVFIVPSMFEFGRIKLARIGFIAYGICHIVTVLWIVYFLFSQPASGIFSTDNLTRFMKDGGFVYSLTFWDTYSFTAAVFSIIYGVLAIYTGLYFDKDKSTVKLLVLSLFVLRIILPFFNNILTQDRVFSLFWLTNNALEIASQLFFTIGILLAGASDYTWIEFVWDQLVFAENEDAEQ